MGCRARCSTSAITQQKVCVRCGLVVTDVFAGHLPCLLAGNCTKVAACTFTAEAHLAVHTATQLPLAQPQARFRQALLRCQTLSEWRAQQPRRAAAYGLARACTLQSSSKAEGQRSTTGHSDLCVMCGWAVDRAAQHMHVQVRTGEGSCSWLLTELSAAFEAHHGTCARASLP